MPYQLEWLEDGVVFHFSGVLTSAEVLASNRAVYTDERFHGICYQIVDFMAVEHFDVLSADIREIAIQDNEVAKNKPDMFVVGITDQELIHGFFRMYELASGDSPWESQLVTNWSDARLCLEEHLPASTVFPEP